MNIRGLFVDHIEGVDLAFEREMEAAYTMLQLDLMDAFEADEAVCIALLRKGNGRILRSDDAVFFHALVEEFGVDEAWEAALAAGFFKHMDRPTLPDSVCDLNSMSDADCISRFRFDHYRIQRLVVLLALRMTIIVPGHRDRINQVEAVCLLLDRMAYPRKYADLVQRYARHECALPRIFKYVTHKVLIGAMAIDRRLLGRQYLKVWNSTLHRFKVGVYKL